jgi:hypothetical protein
MLITKTKTIKLIADTDSEHIEYVITTNPDNNKYVNLSSGDATITIPTQALYYLSQALQEFEC